MKTPVKVILIILAVILAIVLGYFAYLLIAYHRAGDMDIEPAANEVTSQPGAREDGIYTIVSYNIGFGAYESDYGFFMDGGHESWAWSKERLDTNLKNISSLLGSYDSDFCIVQEVDINSTRSYHYDEREYILPAFKGYFYTFAENWDSPFLFYPFYQPHGFARSGLMVFSKYAIDEAKRVELPVEDSIMKLIDLDRCYSKNIISGPDGKKIVIYNVHLSAYTSDGTIATEQLKMLLADMQEEYGKGSYCIAGGDFNKDLLGDSSVYFGKSDKEYNWAQPIPDGLLDSYGMTLVAPLDEANPVASCRNADSAYHEGQYRVTVDGFIVSPNISVKSSEVVDTGYAYSDHNPVIMRFSFE